MAKGQRTPGRCVAAGTWLAGRIREADRGGGGGGSARRFSLLPLREKVAEPSEAKARSDEGCWTEWKRIGQKRRALSSTPRPSRRGAPIHLLPQGEKGGIARRGQNNPLTCDF